MQKQKKKKLTIDQIIYNAKKAALLFKNYDQEQTDRIVKAAYTAGFNNRIHLARLANEETGIGRWQDKVIKNVIATKYVYEDIKDIKTIGITSEDKKKGIIEIAQPIGPVFAITPVTNPTSTVLFKILIALKTRNSLIIRPHGAARKCSIEAARICYEAALKEGAPKNCIQWTGRTTQEQTQRLMRHKDIALVLASGSVELVREAFSSGNPAIGVGKGNVPVFIGKTADVPFAVEQIFISKIFDNGLLCASEQALVVRKCHVKEVKKEFLKRKAYFLSPEEIKKLEPVIYNSALKMVKSEILGRPAPEIAKMADINVPDDTTLLIAELEAICAQCPLSLSILAPVLAFYVADTFNKAIDLCKRINHNGGLGHTASIFSNEENNIQHFANEMNAGRIIVNTPSSQGALGGTYNKLNPSLTLACGTGGKNITTDNISVKHLLNIQRIAYRKVDGHIEKNVLNKYFDDTVEADHI